MVAKLLSSHLHQPSEELATHPINHSNREVPSCLWSTRKLLTSLCTKQGTSSLYRIMELHFLIVLDYRAHHWKGIIMYYSHRHLRKIDWLRAFTACLVCLVSTVSGCSKIALGKGSASSWHITNLSNLLFFRYLWLYHWNQYTTKPVLYKQNALFEPCINIKRINSLSLHYSCC